MQQNDKMDNSHEQYMKRCILLGSKAKLSGCAAVGSVVALNGEVIAEGMEGEPGFPGPIAHAEMVAILKAIQHLGSKDLGHCILYSTKEPCIMCSWLIRQTGVKQVVFAQPAGEIGGVGSIFPILTTPEIKKWPSPPLVVVGILKEECNQILN